ncbi:MAG TPA: PAS domain S-box protein [Candidatus Krumholzibacteria bacterium]|nr:PAS domain S-box protein [Candidatus Krumholzibacteria bacterium]
MPSLTATPRRFRRLLPWLFAALGAVATLLWWWRADSHENRIIDQATRITATQVSLRLEAWVAARSAALEQFARGSGARATARIPFATAAGRLIALYPDLQAINLIDQDGVIVTVVPEDGNRGALGRNVRAHSPAIAAAFEQADHTDGLVFGPVIELFQGGRGITTYRALTHADGTPDGFVNGVFRLDTLVDTCLPEASLRDSYGIRLLDGSGTEQYRHPARTRLASAHEVQLPVRIFGQVWTLQMAPSPDLVAASRPWADEVSGVALLVFVAAITILLRAHLQDLEQLAESRARYRLIVEHAGDMIAKVDAQGRFQYVSPSYCRTFGKSEDELLGRDFMPMVHEEDRAPTAEALARLAAPPHTAYHEQRVLTQAGWRWVSWLSSAVLGPDGRIESIVGVGRDITVRKGLEEQLQQAQKMQAVGQLAGGIAHDFNNILQTVLGGLVLARDDLPAGHPVLKELDLVQQGAERAAGLTRQLLSFSRHQPIETRPVDLNRLVNDHLTMLRRIIGGTMDLVFTPDAGISWVAADAGQLEQVLMNLCVNARDASRGQGRIDVATGQVVIGPDDRRAPAAGPGTYVCVRVSDHGCGMDEETRTRIFEPFFSTKGPGRGTGLGLAMVYGIVQRHRGCIDVTSLPGEGATFTVCLPRVDAPAATDDRAKAPAAPAASVAARPGTILLAEDDEDVRALAKRALQGAGYTVIAAVDGIEAVELARRHRDEIGVAILDVVMPRAGGPQAAAEILSFLPGLPLVFASGYAPDPELARLQAAGRVAFLAKPYRLGELLAGVDRALDPR